MLYFIQHINFLMEINFTTLTFYTSYQTLKKFIVDPYARF
ncbi:hypothetical protein Ga0061079_103116 [Apibacter mensalis]|uniref:Uncharacterized protein n=1 Tax=Apibacter mensalis TaxID=1586267 RepID=A0A0X3AN52_9FLAO|nr:hypothetical protein Ga0061079_103116 [Apibacter mensalis]